jgi:hypothetical protein
MFLGLPGPDPFVRGTDPHTAYTDKRISMIYRIPVRIRNPDPHIFGPPGSGSIGQRYGSGSYPFFIKVLSGLKYCLQNNILTRNFRQKIKFLRLKIVCLRESYKKIWKFGNDP